MPKKCVMSSCHAFSAQTAALFPFFSSTTHLLVEKRLTKAAKTYNSASKKCSKTLELHAGNLLKEVQTQRLHGCSHQSKSDRYAAPEYRQSAFEDVHPFLCTYQISPDSCVSAAMVFE